MTTPEAWIFDEEESEGLATQGKSNAGIRLRQGLLLRE